MEAARVTAPARFVVVRPIGEGATSEVLEVVDVALADGSR